MGLGFTQPLPAAANHLPSGPLRTGRGAGRGARAGVAAGASAPEPVGGLRARLSRLFGGLCPFNDNASPGTALARHRDAAQRYPHLFGGLLSAHVRHRHATLRSYLAVLRGLGELLSKERA
jgi:hypothetical protein